MSKEDIPPNGGEDDRGKQRNRAYTPDEWLQLRDQAQTLVEKLVITVAPFSGITANGLAHLREDWIAWEEDVVRINVPKLAPCNTWKLVSGENTNSINLLSPRDEPCCYCRLKGETDKFEHRWNGASSEPQGYRTFLHRELAEPAVETLNLIFQSYGRSEVGTQPGSLMDAADRLTDEECYSYSKLLRTGPVLYSQYGLEPSEIAEVVPYTEDHVQTIVYATPGMSFERNGTWQYLKAIATVEPATASNLAEELDIKQESIYTSLHRLEEEDRIEIDRSSRPHIAEVIGDWKEPFQCELCGFETHSIKGIRDHRDQKNHSE